jgi:hypothetical protein
MNFQCLDREIWIPSGFLASKTLCAARFAFIVGGTMESDVISLLAMSSVFRERIVCVESDCSTSFICGIPTRSVCSDTCLLVVSEWELCKKVPIQSKTE